MTSKQLEEIKQVINEELVKTETSIVNLKELTKPIAPENAIGRVSRMDAINNKSVNEAALRTADLKFKNLQITLSNINNPNFGICAKCKSQIPLGRIMIRPHSRFCVNCAS
ncbi:TraR/DksA family transcriptional regulator [Lacinutrix jangbogonensis]|uniref:TraR/DksA family transcriptional regulator n=1 Tax=Lacinutrix jangbogonensis TaxID=1469557 RepID=UPI00053F2855|nr:TraR/DksA C4-type zinc finger protein [Lacinutrix jangbogonensis]